LYDKGEVQLEVQIRVVTKLYDRSVTTIVFRQSLFGREDRGGGGANSYAFLVRREPNIGQEKALMKIRPQRNIEENACLWAQTHAGKIRCIIERGSSSLSSFLSFFSARDE